MTKADIFLMPQGEVNSHEVLEELQSDLRIAYTYGAHRNVLHMRTPSEEQYTQVAIEVYETPLDSHVNLYYYEGRMPIGLTEAAVGYGMAKSKNIQIGDTLYINKFDTYITVTVVGIYPSFYDGGETIQMTTDDMDAFFNGGNLGALDKSPATIFAPPLSDRFTRFSVKYRPVFALKTRKTDEKIRRKSDDGLLSKAPRLL